MDQILSPSFQPQLIEAKWYDFWEQGGFFKAEANSSKRSFSIIMPPPNVTGTLHMGHALDNTLQDILVRWKRMSGFETIWLPGTDHAGIATQTIVEQQQLKKKYGKFTREQAIAEAWSWTDEKGKQIVNQIRKLGASCDWSRLSFSMDKERSRAVRSMFKKLFDEGLIYRGNYLVNWDPVTQTALSDDEVEYEEREDFLYYIRYPLVDAPTRFLVVATVRPETLMGDSAVAVSPLDPRYQQWIGKSLLLPIVDRIIPIIGDKSVDQRFGTGAVKVTPAHDPEDYEMAERHQLPLINIMTPSGDINENGAPFTHLSMKEARQAVVERLSSLGLIEKVEPYRHRVGFSYRSKATIEPYLSKQWFVRLKHFKKKLIEMVESKQVELIPHSFEQTYFHWIDQLRDWCISRQIWWGHPIPIWYRIDDPSEMICYAEEGSPPEVDQNRSAWVQDRDVLDTWFSSAIWPLSCLGWPEQSKSFTKFYPTSLLITGRDILFFWVARMMMMGSYATETAPFSQVFLHGLIFGKSYWRSHPDGTISYLSAEERLKYDLGEKLPSDLNSRWEKMSKSKGNVIDPISMIESYGTDAVRITLASLATQAQQIDLDRRRFEEFKNFANKLWNGARFILIHTESLQIEKEEQIEIGSLEDRWIISRLNKTVGEINHHLSKYAFDKAVALSYNFFWNELCAYYLEIVKPTLLGKAGNIKEKREKQKLLLFIVSTVVRLLHPIMPFITEELFQILKKRWQESPIPSDIYLKEALTALSSASCIIAPYPKVLGNEDLDGEKLFSSIEKIVHAIRHLRAEMEWPSKTPTLFSIKETTPLLFSHRSLIEALVPSKVSTSLDLANGEKIVTISAESSELEVLIEPSLLQKKKEHLLKKKKKLAEKLDQLKSAQKEKIESSLREKVEAIEKELSTLSEQLEQW